MKRSKHYWFTSIFLISCLIFMSNPGFADDTCVFAVTADDVPPNIILLLDNGAEMEQIVWHPNYNNSIDYTPNPATPTDVVPNGASGNGFFNDNGYGIVKQGSDYYLVPVLSTLELGSYSDGLSLGSSGTYGTVTLPVVPSTSVDADGVKDNAATFRYSKNYLNWLFFAKDAGGSPLYDGSALPDESRFYYAKKAIFAVAKLTANQASFSIYNFTSNHSGASNVQPLGMVVTTPLAALPENNTLNSSFVNNVNNMGTVTYSPLAEGLASVGGYYASPSSHVVGVYCQKSFAIVLTPGVSSYDNYAPSQTSPSSLSDYDEDNAAGGISEGNIKATSAGTLTLGSIVGAFQDSEVLTGGTSGATAKVYGTLIVSLLVYYAKTDDFTVGENVTGGTSGATGTITAIDTSITSPTPIPTNHNGSTYLDDVAHYLYTHDIVGYKDGFQNVITYTIGFMGDQASNLFLINTSNNGNGNKNLYDTTDPEYGKYHFTAESPDTLSSVLMDAISDIISKTTTFTAPVVPVTRTTSGNRIYMAFFTPGDENFWEGNVTKFGLSDDNLIMDASDPPQRATWDNGAIKEGAVPYWQTKDWADSILHSDRNIYTYLGGSRVDFNSGNVTAADLGNPTHTTAEIIDYIRGRDVLDEDDNDQTNENRAVITGDVLHSEPLVVYYTSTTAVVYFGSNDGMLHAVYDEEGHVDNGKELWAFIPPDQLPRLKLILEGTGHQYFVDSSPKAFINDVDEDGVIEAGEQVILICGVRGGGSSYFALDITDYNNPQLLWTIDPSQADFAELGETWSEPQFGVVETTADSDGVDVFFIGGGYSSDNTAGKAVFAVNVSTGALVKKFNTGMNYSFPSSVRLVDSDSNGFVDKVYVGDLGGQVWRFGKFTDAGGDPLAFPNSDENIDNWTGQIIFDSTNARKFFYSPSVALEKEYDLIYMGTGDREDACNTTSSDRIYSVKDTHAAATLTETDLVDVTDPAAPLPDIPGGDNGWYIRLATTGERVLAEGTLFYKTYYLPTFSPNNEPCLPGGVGKIYALSYLTGAAALNFGGEALVRSDEIGGGIPSKPVMVITSEGQKLLISVGSTNPEATSEETGAGIVTIDPLAPPINLFYLWWVDL